MIREEDLLPLQNALLEIARAKTSPGREFLRYSEFCTLLGGRFDGEAVAEMLRELTSEGILAVAPPDGGEDRYCVTEEYLATLAEGK
ncbi:MAG: hypothetical protein K6U03_12520 [Firmicutes bacterium]|nr:hypothetical protein [Bacillota bacterium]